jgi:hypothetical protein
METEGLQTGIIRLLQQELGDEQMVVTENGRVLIQVSRAVFELQLGRFLQQIQATVDRHYPEREIHLSITIRDMEASRENTFKIWGSCLNDN